MADGRAGGGTPRRPPPRPSAISDSRPPDEFALDRKPHDLVIKGEAIVRVARAFWGSIPYDKDVSLHLLTETGGGREREDSTVLMPSRWNTWSRPAYLGWLDLVSHEYFHSWSDGQKAHRKAWLGD